jgi:cysteine synthase
MSIARPQNRDEFRQHVLTKLGAPVIEINVAEEQMDIAIDDAFQYYNERSHFLGTEKDVSDV